ncbi:M16 family metallopeptidase [Salaquimonas pukyongi]|uniref:M16 family metallopeptidase n=1 Tax=Salaquimonas pukyongi TaxID=2712698 RepID=UPI00096BCE9E|nr:pitrilysin family protein [Salaquimonas pukyongi]
MNRNFPLFPATLRFLAVLLMVVGTVTGAQAADTREVTSPSGIRFWIVEDYTVPIVTLSFEFKGGANQDPAGKAGLAAVLAAMMDEGAGGMDAAELKAELEARGIEMGFSSGRDALSGGMRVLAEEVQGAFTLLAGILAAPAFEEQALERIRAGFIQRAVRSKTSPRAILANTMRDNLFSRHPYSLGSRGDERTLARITRRDIVEQHQRIMARDNLTIGIVGAIAPQDAARMVDEAFSALPANAALEPVGDVEPVFGFKKHIEFNTPQTTVSIALPGVKRADPDFFAAYLMNHILGGGTFSSRLYDEVREKRGLVYNIGSNLSTLRHSAYLSAGFSTRPDQAGQALDLMLDEIRSMAENGPEAGELEAAKKFVLGAYAINNLDTSAKIADGLVRLQAEALPIDYVEKRPEYINSVTLDDVREIASRLLSVEPAIVTIGPQPVLRDAAAN